MRAGSRPRIAHAVGEWTAEQGHGSADLGVALVPALAAGAVRPDVVLPPVAARAPRPGGVRGDGTGAVPDACR